ncbi:hypothetical protein NHX12_033406 [Muraenolepis orangiensis]|uniref:Uncharacterized protein n=1 Tax=Muraenolepis orangiensis TaxID=630683 RepID=A0A9Q0IIN4_9TELE|nr:hypothetical protein NHX12_033406 [Muraenolepis orangiensis]
MGRSERRFSAALVTLAVLLVSMATEEVQSTLRPLASPTTSPPGSNSSSSSSGSRPHLLGLDVDSMVVQRALYVLVGFTSLGVLYLLVRAVRMKRPVKKKYGLLENCDDGVELDHLDSDEDNTLYEALRR